MVFVQERKTKGAVYLYLEKSIRIGKSVFKLSRYMGRKEDITKDILKKEKKAFVLDVNKNAVDFLAKQIEKKYVIHYPLNREAIHSLEEMNLKYREIKHTVSKNDWEDIKKRFVANFVFESNALEGNSLTLKNFSEIVFENKISSSADLREVYDAKNSYRVFSKLLTAKKEMSESFILDLHKQIVKNIDARTGYKKLPNIILGRKISLVQPKDVPDEIRKLLQWYNSNKDRIYPLELAFRFHHRFERVHPFADGNGRVGRMLLNYILIKHRYYPVIIRKTYRNKYLKTLEAADHEQYIPLMRFALEKAKETYAKFFEVYYNYI